VTDGAVGVVQFDRALTLAPWAAAENIPCGLDKLDPRPAAIFRMDATFVRLSVHEKRQK